MMAQQILKEQLEKQQTTADAADNGNNNSSHVGEDS
jgi:hypothetical protein